MRQFISILMCLILILGLVSCIPDPKDTETTVIETEIIETETDTESAAVDETTSDIETTEDSETAAASEDTVDPDIDTETDPNAVG